MKIEEFFEYNLYKNCLIKKNNVLSLAEISSNNMGIHSARISTPYVTFCSRKTTFLPKDLYDDLYVKKFLIKLRCMRTTLHIVPIEDAHIYHMATKKIRIQKVNLDFKKFNININIINDIKNFLLKNTEDLLFPGELENIIATYLDEKCDNKKKASKAILKYLWEDGFLCYINVSRNWECEKRMYAITEQFYNGLNLNIGTEEDAQKELISRYISKFGPVTIKDICWWSGISKKDIVNALKKIDNIEVIEIDSKPFYINKNDFSYFKEYKNIAKDYVLLLAYEDSCLKGFYESRNRYVNNKYIDRAFNSIGEVLPCIIYNGRVIGKWSFNKKNKLIDIEYFYTNSKIKKMVEIIKKDYEIRLIGSSQLTIYDIE